MMHTNRRAFLQTLTATGFALTGMGLAQASTGKPAAAAGQEVLAITSATHGHALEAAFVQGAQSVAARVQHSQLLGCSMTSRTRCSSACSMTPAPPWCWTWCAPPVAACCLKSTTALPPMPQAGRSSWARPWSAARATLPLHSPATNPAWPCAA